MKWEVVYYVRNKNLYTSKIVAADSAPEAIRKARVKSIVDLRPVEK